MHATFMRRSSKNMSEIADFSILTIPDTISSFLRDESWYLIEVYGWGNVITILLYLSLITRMVYREVFKTF